MSDAYNTYFNWESQQPDTTFKTKRKLWGEVKSLKPSDKIFWGSRDNTVTCVVTLNGFPGVELGDRLDDGAWYYEVRHKWEEEFETVLHCTTYTRQTEAE